MPRGYPMLAIEALRKLRGGQVSMSAAEMELVIEYILLAKSIVPPFHSAQPQVYGLMAKLIKRYDIVDRSVYLPDLELVGMRYQFSTTPLLRLMTRPLKGWDTVVEYNARCVDWSPELLELADYAAQVTEIVHNFHKYDFFDGNEVVPYIWSEEEISYESWDQTYRGITVANYTKPFSRLVELIDWVPVSALISGIQHYLSHVPTKTAKQDIRFPVSVSELAEQVRVSNLPTADDLPKEVADCVRATFGGMMTYWHGDHEFICYPLIVLALRDYLIYMPAK